MKYTTLLIATTNTGKCKEITELLLQSPLFANTKILNLKDLDPHQKLKEPEENGKTFLENAIIKAKYYSKAFNIDCISDDSGFCVEEIFGMPGVFSARWSNSSSNFDEAIAKLEKILSNKKSKAHFVSALCIAKTDGTIITEEGKIFGDITFPKKGSNGFGYDPIFIPDGYDKTFSEMLFEQKNQICHRTIAFQKLINSITSK
jgi:XTP/dITP diphosphohydrolase